MQRHRYGYGVAALTASALFVSACSGTASTGEASSVTTSVSTSASASADAGTHNDADVAFAQGMIPHHEQAIEMSDMLLWKQGVDPAVVSLADTIKGAQAPEIETMQGWLQQWGVPAAPATSGADMPGHNMPGHDMSGGGGMGDMPGMGGGGHGMMSEADMAALQNAQGAEAGRLFLEQMITHHEGAIVMAQQEIDNGQFPAAVDMARSIVSSQQAEIEKMRTLLAE
ncbi:DUF305 domain-containing protein [Mycolicibacterium frederiksbergense]|uniref:DUF305 domain-containing protein n=1 Tax=Mycolicibacterium frederiksbergense TaxID=117567 RepID=A0A6H0S5Q7_9MYCO|nr:DUF305 domain-containing protein [Mycolicibacterium frederiksbergense]QIV82490.1 DUF305 domain-containing protein [Mycolicibacterium frederiksbergense]